MIPLPIQDWHIFLRDGRQFLRTARAAHRVRKSAFTPETIYNLVCMGIEKLIMAFLMQRGDLAENHTMTDLQRALERHLGRCDERESQLRFLDSFQEICDLDTYVIKKPDESDLKNILAAADLLQDSLEPFLAEGGGRPAPAAPLQQTAP